MRKFHWLLVAALSSSITFSAYASSSKESDLSALKFGSQAAYIKDLDHSVEHDKYPKVRFSSQISFGDSLSDVGSYAVGTIAALGGGQFTINSPGVKNWSALTAAKFGLAAPCAAQTGLDGDPALGFSVLPPLNHTGCTSYAQGGARVTDPIGVGNKLTGGANASLGFLTVPIVQQIQNHLNLKDGKFKDDEIVFVFAGANDVFFQLGLLQAGATSPTAAISSVANAASQLATAIHTQIVGNGAKYVVVMNIPNIAITPFGNSLNPSARGLLDYMVNTFNSLVQAGVGSNESVLYLDSYSESTNQYNNPAAYGLSNVTDTACDLSPEKNPLASSLICNQFNLIPGNTDQYLFADRVHPTPYGYSLIAQLVIKEMRNKGWRWHKHPVPGLEK
jgi:outer membrane lipase/esterase